MATTIDGTTGVATSNITLTGNYTEGVVAIGNSGTTKTLSLTNGTFQTVTLTGNCTFTMPTATAGQSFLIVVTQDATGGRTATFTGVKYPGGTVPVITVAASAIDIVSFVSNGTSWFGSAAQAFA
jgi:hypothetical protein